MGGRLAELLATEHNNSTDTSTFGMLATLLDVFLSILGIERNFTQFRGILKKLRSKNWHP